MSAIPLKGKTSYINWSYIPETFCIISVGQYIMFLSFLSLFLEYILVHN